MVTGDVAFVVSCVETGTDAAILPGGGAPSAVKSACCCARVMTF
jgi:fructose-1,6-bisphosphatase/sedoheptulose 1,7-bisphosphatase-like protein